MDGVYPLNYVTQRPHEDACQQACIAMLTGKCLKDVIELCGSGRINKDTRDAACPNVKFEHPISIDALGVCSLGHLLRHNHILWCTVGSHIDLNMNHSVLISDSILYDPWCGVNPEWPWHWYIQCAEPVGIQHVN